MRGLVSWPAFRQLLTCQLLGAFWQRYVRFWWRSQALNLKPRPFKSTTTLTHNNKSNRNHIYRLYNLQGSGCPTSAPGFFHRPLAANGLSLRAGKTINPAVRRLKGNASFPRCFGEKAGKRSEKASCGYKSNPRSSLLAIPTC